MYIWHLGFPVYFLNECSIQMNMNFAWIIWFCIYSSVFLHFAYSTVGNPHTLRIPIFLSSWGSSPRTCKHDCTDLYHTCLSYTTCYKVVCTTMLVCVIQLHHIKASCDHGKYLLLILTPKVCKIYFNFNLKNSTDTDHSYYLCEQILFVSVDKTTVIKWVDKRNNL